MSRFFDGPYRVEPWTPPFGHFRDRAWVVVSTHGRESARFYDKQNAEEFCENYNMMAAKEILTQK